MKISEAILKLERLKSSVGDVEVFFDCPDCKRVSKPDVIVVEPQTVVLREKTCP